VLDSTSAFLAEYWKGGWKSIGMKAVAPNRIAEYGQEDGRILPRRMAECSTGEWQYIE
jgi:hypothetical protein